MLKPGVLSLTLSELAQAYRLQTIAVSEVVDKVLAQQKVMQDLNTLITATPHQKLKDDTAKAQERQESGRLLSAVDGVPVVVKDNFCTSWARTTCGSNMLRNYTPPYSATLVRRLEQAGAIIIGKSNMDEFGMGSAGVNSSFGPVKNLYASGRPYQLQGQQGHKQQEESVAADDWLCSGGSSSGSSVAVAAGLAYGGLGSDTGGSVRNPASYCGLVGFKPSYGSLSRHGLVSLVNSMDSPGVLARTCEDAAALMAVLTELDQADSTSQPNDCTGGWSLRPLGDLKGVVVGVPLEYHCQGLHLAVVRRWQRMADDMERAGAKVVRVSLPHTKFAPPCYSVLNTCEVASNYTRFTGVEFGLQVGCSHSMEAQFALSRAKGLSQVVRDRVLAGNYFLLKRNRERYYDMAAKVRRLVSRDFERVWRGGVQLLLCPTTLCPAPRPSTYETADYSELTYLQDICTSPTNLAGLPALALPVGFTGATDPSSADPSDESSAGTADDSSHDFACPLPLSLQLIGPPGSDRRLLEVGKWMQEQAAVPRTLLQDPGQPAPRVVTIR